MFRKLLLPKAIHRFDQVHLFVLVLILDLLLLVLQPKCIGVDKFHRGFCCRRWNEGSCASWFYSNRFILEIKKGKEMCAVYGVGIVYGLSL